MKSVARADTFIAAPTPIKPHRAGCPGRTGRHVGLLGSCRKNPRRPRGRPPDPVATSPLGTKPSPASGPLIRLRLHPEARPWGRDAQTQRRAPCPIGCVAGQEPKSRSHRHRESSGRRLGVQRGSLVGSGRAEGLWVLPVGVTGRLRGSPGGDTPKSPVFKED